MKRLQPWTCVLFFGIAIIAAPSGAGDLAKAESPVFARTLYLIRHGAYDTHDKADHETGKALTPLGIAQARMLAARLRGLPVQFNSMTSSTLTRARETAAVIHEELRGLPSKQSPLLSECTPPRENGEVPVDADEGACERRLDQAFQELFSPAQSSEQNDLLVCHGNVIRYFVAKALGVDTHAWTRMSVAHASLTVIRIRPDGSMSVRAVGDVGHMPPTLQSWGIDTDPQLVAPMAKGSAEVH